MLFHGKFFSLLLQLLSSNEKYKNELGFCDSMENHFRYKRYFKNIFMEKQKAPKPIFHGC